MRRARDLIHRLNGDERGQTATEYVGVLLVAVGLTIGVVWFVLGDILTGVIADVGANLQSFSDSVVS